LRRWEEPGGKGSSWARPLRLGDHDQRARLGMVLGEVLAVTCLVVWAAGEVAGRLAGGSWPKVPVTWSAGILAGLVTHPSQPALAWPRSARELLPGPAPFYGVLAGIVLLSGAVLLAGLAAARVTEGPRGADRAAAWKGRLGSPPCARASWARRRDLRPLAVRRPTQDRLTLGRSGRHLLAAEPGQSVIVVGPTQTLKTSGFAVPAILEWRGPVVATSVKTDLVRDTLAWRQGCGQVWVYDPAASTGLPPSGWSPLSGAFTWAGARRVAAALCGEARSREGFADADFWYATAAKLLAPLLLAAACSGLGMSDVVRWVDEQDSDEVERILLALDQPEALRAAAATWRREERQRSSVYTTAETVLEAFADPAVASSTARSEIDPAVLLDGGWHTLLVCAPAHEQRRLRPAFNALVSQFLQAAYERVARQGQPLAPPLLVVLDEAANIAPLADLDGLAATAAGHGIQLVSIWQDMAQVAARYGGRAATVVNNHRAKVVLSGISDPATLEHVSALLGEEEATQTSSTTDADGRSSVTRGVSLRRLAPADAIRRIRPGEGILVYGYLRPARIRLRPWFKDRDLARRAKACRPSGRRATGLTRSPASTQTRDGRVLDPLTPIPGEAPPLGARQHGAGPPEPTRCCWVGPWHPPSPPAPPPERCV
jgi:type IV secretion system protein VirD4